jgi:hypothetical protein
MEEKRHIDWNPTSGNGPHFAAGYRDSTSSPCRPLADAEFEGHGHLDPIAVQVFWHWWKWRGLIDGSHSGIIEYPMARANPYLSRENLAVRLNHKMHDRGTRYSRARIDLCTLKM